jgi:hypothetical protein
VFRLALSIWKSRKIGVSARISGFGMNSGFDGSNVSCVAVGGGGGVTGSSTVEEVLVVRVFDEDDEEKLSDKTGCSDKRVS